jgi:hypothetical protein
MITLAEMFDLTEAEQRFSKSLLERPEAGSLRANFETYLGRRFVESASSGAADGLKHVLDVRIDEVLRWGWTRHDELREALNRSRSTDGTVFMSLGEHRIESKHQPAIELYLLEKRMGSIQFDVTLELVVEAVTLEVQAGRVRRARTGRCSASGKLMFLGQELCKRSSREIDLPGVIEFDEQRDGVTAK